jgi:signal transduction histidine kinase
VTDHGPGVDPADRERLFGRYERGRRGGASGGDGSGEGSGLGLYVSQALCRAMGGDLVLEPQAPAGGAAFTVILAAERAEEG